MIERRFVLQKKRKDEKKARLRPAEVVALDAREERDLVMEVTGA